jgi:hypothetical protein
VRRKTTGDWLFEGREIDDDLTLLEMEGDEPENGYHSLGIRRSLQRQHHSSSHEKGIARRKKASR